MLIKPTESIIKIGYELINSLESFSIHLKKNQRLDFDSIHDAVYFLESGTVSVFRLSDDVLTTTMTSPAVLGLTQLRNNNRYHYLRCSEDSIIWVITKDRIEQLFNDKGLWIYACDILSYLSNIYYHRDVMSSRKSVREIVIQHVKHIWELPPEQRKNTSVYRFILTRNHISRSAIHKDIRALLDSELISIQRGKLTHVDMDAISNF